MNWCWSYLSYSRLQNPAQLPEQVEVSLDEFIDSILGSVDEELESPEIVIDVLLHGQLERFSLDPRLTARAIQNLLRNAMRYCEKRIQIGVQVNAEGCEIWVDDDGIGIPDDERERIFEPFYRLDRSRDRATGGFGLGLAISRRALEAQGGTLTVEGSPLGRCALQIVVAHYRLACEELHVGLRLLAMAICQSSLLNLTLRHREQAHSYRGFYEHRKSLWERACSRKRRISRHLQRWLFAI
jgi:signal transduction histidine kinase